MMNTITTTGRAAKIALPEKRFICVHVHDTFRSLRACHRRDQQHLPKGFRRSSSSVVAYFVPGCDGRRPRHVGDLHFKTGASDDVLAHEAAHAMNHCQSVCVGIEEDVVRVFDLVFARLREIRGTAPSVNEKFKVWGLYTPNGKLVCVAMSASLSLDHTFGAVDRTTVRRLRRQGWRTRRGTFHPDYR